MFAATGIVGWLDKSGVRFLAERKCEFPFQGIAEKDAAIDYVSPNKGLDAIIPAEICAHNGTDTEGLDFAI